MLNRWKRLCEAILRKRFRLCFWPLDLIEDTGEIRLDDFPLDASVRNTRFPTRAMRYWWAASAIREESRRAKSALVIVDAGCERGMLKRLTPIVFESKWIGLDKNWLSPHLKRARYDHYVTCDFTQGLPLRSGTADVVVCLHVLEHMPDPDFTLRELVRILKPGGMLLLALPVLPHFLARMRQKQFDRDVAIQKRAPGSHVYAFSRQKLFGLTADKGLQMECMAGSHLLRCSGSPLESIRLWVRINQLWGSLFPSLGRELFAQFRLSISGYQYAKTLNPGKSRKKGHRAALVAWAATAGLFAFLFPPLQRTDSSADRIYADFVRKNQDGDDRYYLLGYSGSNGTWPDFKLLSMSEFHSIEKIRQRDDAGEKDSHFIIPEEEYFQLAMKSGVKDHFSMSRRHIGSKRFIIMTAETDSGVHPGSGVERVLD